MTYGFSTSAFCPSSGCGPGDVVGAGTFLPIGFENEFANAFAAWSAVADIDFVMAATPETADIKIAGDNSLTGNALAYA